MLKMERKKKEKEKEKMKDEKTTRKEKRSKVVMYKCPNASFPGSSKLHPLNYHLPILLSLPLTPWMINDFCLLCFKYVFTRFGV